MLHKEIKNESTERRREAKSVAGRIEETLPNLLVIDFVVKTEPERHINSQNKWNVIPFCIIYFLNN